MKRPPPTIATVESGGGETVLVAPLAISAWKWLPRAARARSIIVGPDGTRCRVNDDGSVDEILPGGHPHAGAASDPVNTRSFQVSFPFAFNRGIA